MSFRYRDGTQKNGVPVDEAVAEIVAAVEARAGLSVSGEPAGRPGTRATE